MLCLQRSGGFIAIVSGQLIVFGSYSSAMSPCVCEETLEKMGELAECSSWQECYLCSVSLSLQLTTSVRRGSKLQFNHNGIAAVTIHVRFL